MKSFYYPAAVQSATFSLALAQNLRHRDPHGPEAQRKNLPKVTQQVSSQAQVSILTYLSTFTSLFL